RVLVMSATLDGDAVARFIDAPVVRATGRMYPVETRYLGSPEPHRLIPETVAAVRRALREEQGSILVFLPGVGEIRRAARALEDGGLPDDTALYPLYGDLPCAAQDAAIAPALAGQRKVVLATAIAETSLTIDGVRVVIDAGRMRRPVFDPASGMTRLETVRVSTAAAEQRRGRAGRLEPGVCYRLWSEAEDGGLLAATPPEIENADLARLALELAVWGTPDPSVLKWLNPPPAGAYGQAQSLLRQLGAVDEQGRVMPHGRSIAAMPTHPRLAHMIVKAREDGLEREAALIAALLGERDILRTDHEAPDADIRTRLALLQKNHAPGSARIVASARQILRDPHADFGTIETESAGRLLALAYPDRIARRRVGDAARYRLANGRGAALDEADALAREQYLAVANLDGQRREGRIFLAAPINREDIEALYPNLVRSEAVVRWDSRTQSVDARRVVRFEALELQAAPLASPDRTAITAAVLDGIRELGIGALPWDRETAALRARIAFCRHHDSRPDYWPEVSDEALLATLEVWLAPFLGDVTRAAEFNRVDLKSALLARLDWDRQQALDKLAPSHLGVPSGSRIRLDYGDGKGPPVLAVRLQEMFGARETPKVMDGRVAVLLHLLSPAHRPVQVTQDLPTFWQTGYPQVKAELKGRYPKHYWPNDPLEAEPTARVRPRTVKR
ncbi:MAG: ATP-dependent helicase HrpB, partial [Alphaproteobacteria bacterium]